MRTLVFAVVLMLSWGVAQANSIPEISFEDLRAMYSKSKSVFDWTWPRASIKNQAELVKECQADFATYFRETRFKEKYSIATGTIHLWSVLKDPDSDIIYLTFKIDPDDLPDAMIVYFYNPGTNHLVFKFRLSLG